MLSCADKKKKDEPKKGEPCGAEIPLENAELDSASYYKRITKITLVLAIRFLFSAVEQPTENDYYISSADRCGCSIPPLR